MKHHYRLPDGTYVDMFQTYRRAWRKIARPIEKATNSKCYGYDPGLAFIVNSNRSFSFELGIYQAQAFAAIIEAGSDLAKAVDEWEHTADDEEYGELIAHKKMLDACAVFKKLLSKKGK